LYVEGGFVDVLAETEAKSTDNDSEEQTGMLTDMLNAEVTH